MQILCVHPTSLRVRRVDADHKQSDASASCLPSQEPGRWFDGHSGGVHPVPFRTRQLSPPAYSSRTGVGDPPGKRVRCRHLPFHFLSSFLPEPGLRNAFSLVRHAGFVPELAVGDKAPDFELFDDRGERVRLSEFAGQPVVLYFYPEDDSPGCTVQACGFRDDISKFEDVDAVVMGVSPDSVESHAAFRKKFKLPFMLLSDPGNVVATRYESYGEKQLYGQTVVGTIRSTFVIGPDRTILGIFRNVRTEGHSGRMLEQLGALVK